MENFLLSQQHDSLKHVFILKYSAAHDGHDEWKCRKKCAHCVAPTKGVGFVQIMARFGLDVTSA